MSAFVKTFVIGRPDRRLALSVLLLLFGAYAATFSGVPDNPDGEITFQTTSALARRGSLALGGTPEAERIIAWARSRPPGATPVRAGAGPRSDASYAWFGVAQSGLAVPMYYLGRATALVLRDLERRHTELGFHGRESSEYFEHIFVGLRNPLLGALTGFLIVLAARRMSVGRSAAWWAGASYGLTTFAWPQARSSLSDVQATFFLLLAFHLILRLRERFDRLDSPRFSDLAWVGTALGAALLTRTSTAPACLVLLGLTEALVRGGRRRLAASRRQAAQASRLGSLRALAVLVAPIAAAALIFVATNQWRFGHPLDSGYAHALEGGLFSPPTGARALGLLVSPGRGLVWMAPLVLLLPWGLVRGWKRSEHLWGAALLGVVASTFLTTTALVGWHGAWTYGPRYLLPSLPFLWLGVALAFEAAAEHRGLRVAAVALGILGFIVQVPGVLVDHMTHQDLAVRAARIAWPGPAGEEDSEPLEADAEARRFERIQWDWRFAAPWAHWRILRHRAAAGTRHSAPSEEFGVREIFFLDSDVVLRPTHGRDEGFRHLAVVDAVQRLGVPWWLLFGSISAFIAAGLGLALAGLGRPGG